MKRALFALFLILAGPAPVAAERITVAVAANFLPAAQDIARAFEAATGDDVTLAHGATGRLYAQIVAGAPYDVFLSADSARPERLEREGLAAPDGRMSYAIGRLVLVQRSDQPPGQLFEILRRDTVLAIADPAIAPYGAAAAEVLRAARGEAWRRGLVLGDSVGQAFAFVATGNAPAGLVALAQLRGFDGDLRVTDVPAALHAPIAQDAVLLSRAAGNPAARRFMDFLGQPQARAIIAQAGYEAPQ